MFSFKPFTSNQFSADRKDAPDCSFKRSWFVAEFRMLVSSAYRETSPKETFAGMEENNCFLPYPKGFSTAVCHFAQQSEQWSPTAIVPPIFTSTIYKLHGAAIEKEKYIVSQWGNPSRDLLENLLAQLENAKYGVCFSSGSAAIATCFALLEQGDHVLCVSDIYGGTRKQLSKLAVKYGILTTFVDCQFECFGKLVQPNTKMIFVETPTNPCLNVIEIEAISKIAKDNKIICVVDNTFLTPFLQRPLNFGAQISLQSVSKYLNGHSDVVMGALMMNDDKLFDEIKNIQKTIGNVPSPFDCSQVMRGLKTLPLRIIQQGKSCYRIALFLEKHPKIEKVSHPGLKTHPGYEITKKQTSGHSGMLSFYLKGNNIEISNKFIQSLKIVSHAASFGGYTTVVEIPSLISHASLSKKDKEELNYTDNMIRLSVGLEDIEDLIEDLHQALEKI